MARAGSAPLNDRPGAGATKSWCIEGMAASEIDPKEASLMGTVRHPRTTSPSSPASLSMATRASAASEGSRDKKAMPVA